MFHFEPSCFKMGAKALPLGKVFLISSLTAINLLLNLQHQEVRCNEREHAGEKGKRKCRVCKTLWSSVSIFSILFINSRFPHFTYYFLKKKIGYNCVKSIVNRLDKWAAYWNLFSSWHGFRRFLGTHGLFYQSYRGLINYFSFREPSDWIYLLCP